MQVFVRVSPRRAWNGGRSGSGSGSESLSGSGSGGTRDGEYAISLGGGSSKLIFAAKGRIAAGTWACHLNWIG